MSKGQKAAPRSEWAQVTRTKQNEWKKNNRSVLGADMPKREADSFRAICKKENVSVSAALSQYVRAAIHAGTLDIIRDDIPGTRDDDGTTTAGSRLDDDGRAVSVDPAFPQGDQANENDTPGTVCRHPVSDTPGTV